MRVKSPLRLGSGPPYERIQSLRLRGLLSKFDIAVIERIVLYHILLNRMEHVTQAIETAVQFAKEDTVLAIVVSVFEHLQRLPCMLQASYGNLRLKLTLLFMQIAAFSLAVLYSLLPGVSSSQPLKSLVPRIAITRVL